MPAKFTVDITDIDGYASALDNIRPGLKQPLHFLNAPFYGQWQTASGKTVSYFIVKKAGKLVGCGLGIAYALPGGYYYLYCPYGPIVTDWAAAGAIRDFFKTSFDRKLLFARLDADNLPKNFPRSSQAAAGTAALQPRNEWLLDITPKTDDLLAGMHKKCRYHINLAERKGASFRAEQCDLKQLEIFYKMLKATAERDKFHILPKSDYRAVFETLGSTSNAFVGYTDIDGQPVAAALIVSYDGQAHYVYGASSDKFRKIGPGYYLHWQCILKLKEAGDTIYNLGGVSGGVKGAQLASVSRFKQRFGGYGVSHGLPADIAVSPLGYRLFDLYKHIRPHR